MADVRSKSYDDGKRQMKPYCGPPSTARPNDFRSYSVCSSSSAYYYTAPPAAAPQKLKKGKSTNRPTSKSWSFNDAEFQRKRRVARYKVYSVEGKVKGSLRKSFRWLKGRYTQVLYGWW